MKIKIQQFLFGGELLSWAIVGQNIGRSFLKQGHDVSFVSTDGIVDRYLPSDLAPYASSAPAGVPQPVGVFDMQVSYTAMHNFPRYIAFENGINNRFGIYNYDGTVIPPNMVKFYHNCNLLLPSSNFSKEVMIKSKIPEDRIRVIPHGINLDDYSSETKYPLQTKKKYKILLNIATPHLRKNLRNTLRAYAQAFTKNDDVCLVIKITLNKDKDKKSKENHKASHVNFTEELKALNNRYKDCGEIEVVSGFVPSLVDLYNACDIVFMMSNIEMWWLPGIEAFAKNKVVIASNYSGQLHYLNTDNSLLIDGKVINMPATYQYYEPSPYAEMFEPSIDDAVSKLRYAVSNFEELKNKFEPKMKEVIQTYTWDNVGKMILDLVK